MGHKCCVPKCRANYRGGPKAHVFRFPENDERKNLWLSAIPREHYVPNKHSRVCGSHFKSEDVLWESVYFDKRSGRTLTAPLSNPRLREDAVPSLFPGRPLYMSRHPRKEQQPLETGTLEHATAGSSQVHATSENLSHIFEYVDVQVCGENAQGLNEAELNTLKQEVKGELVGYVGTAGEQRVSSVSVPSSTGGCDVKTEVVAQSCAVVKPEVAAEVQSNVGSVITSCSKGTSADQHGNSVLAYVMLNRKLLEQSDWSGLGEDLLNQTGLELRTCSAGNTVYLYAVPTATHAKKTVKMRIVKKAGRKPFVCAICSSTFTRKKLFNNHMYLHSGEKPYSCSLCPSTFTEKGSLKIHYRIHSGERPFACTLCPARFYEKSKLNKHNRVHSGERPFSCAVCGATFSQKAGLVKHVVKHTGEEPFSCPLCPAKFTLKSLLNNHAISHVGFDSSTVKEKRTRRDIAQPNKSFLCSFCPAMFSLQSSLYSHLKCHSGEKPFSCSHCHARFTSKASLKAHIYAHIGEKPFACSLCPAKFTQSTSLTKHSRIHTGERPFSCLLCPARFYEKRRKALHMRVHTGEKPFSCALCSARFSWKSNLKSHILVHIGETPFSCSLCQAKFVENSRLKKHMMKHADVGINSR